MKGTVPRKEFHFIVKRHPHSLLTTFGRYMSPIPSAEGDKISWVNYHTGLKDVYFRMDAGKRSATISISLEHSDPDLQQLYYDQFLEMKDILHATLGEEWGIVTDSSTVHRCIAAWNRDARHGSIGMHSSSAPSGLWKYYAHQRRAAPCADVLRPFRPGQGSLLRIAL